MARVLFAWEFGAGLGHLTRLLPIAEALRKAGHEPIFAVQNLRTLQGLMAERLGTGGGFPMLPAPYWQPPRNPKLAKLPSYSFADVLKLFRYHDAGLLASMVEGWSGLLEMIAPSLVVADFTPTLRIVVDQCPLVVVGNGYTVPPCGRSLPPVRPWRDKLPPASVMAEEQILGAVNAVCKARGRSPVAFLSDIFSGDETFVCTIPEFDPYAAYRHQPTLTPFNLPSVERPPAIESRPERSIFLYLPADHPNLLAVLEAVVELDLDCDAFVRGASGDLRNKFASSRRRFHDRPQPLGEVLPRVRAIVHHGGLGTAYVALLAGTPQLVITRNLEHQVTAYGLTRFKVVAALTGNRIHEREAVANALRSLLGNPEIWRSARDAAETLAPRALDPSLETVVRACEGHLPK